MTNTNAICENYAHKVIFTNKISAITMFSALVETIYRATRKGGKNTGEDGRKWKLLVLNQNELFSQP